MDFKTFKEKYEHRPVEEYPNTVKKNPLVSILVLTYNHVDFIADCLESLLSQKADFAYEILIGEDGSTDGTREKCLEYAKKYPDRIRLFLHHRENNIAVNGNPSPFFNAMYCIHSSNAPYTAICEGDDYWTDPLKIQKQAGILQKHPEVQLVTGGYTKFYVQSGRTEDVLFDDVSINSESSEGYFFNLEDMRRKWLTKTLTVMYRRNIIDSIDFTKYRFGLDVELFYHLLKRGKGFYFSTILGTYRMHANSLFSSISHINKCKLQFYVFRELYEENEKDDFLRDKLYRVTKDLVEYYSCHKIKNENFSRIYLFSMGARLSKNPHEFFSLVKSSLPYINRIRLRPKPRT